MVASVVREAIIGEGVISSGESIRKKSVVEFESLLNMANKLAFYSDGWHTERAAVLSEIEASG